MNDRTEQRLRNDLTAVDGARVPDVNAVGVAVARVTRRLTVRRRALAGAMAVGLVLAGGVAIWNSSAAREQITSGDGSAPATSSAAREQITTGDGSAPATSSPCCGWSAIPRDPRGPTYQSAVVWTGTEAIAVGGVDPNGFLVGGAAALTVSPSAEYSLRSAAPTLPTTALPVCRPTPM